MKIIMYNVRQDTEGRFVREWAKETGNEVKVVHEPLSADNVNLMKGCDGLDILQTMPIGDEAVYKQIADMGIKQITCRMVGINMIDLAACKKYNLKVPTCRCTRHGQLPKWGSHTQCTSCVGLANTVTKWTITPTLAGLLT